MDVIKIKRGLNIPITGEPEQKIYDGPVSGKVALVGHDYIGMKPRFAVEEGERVRLGQVLFTDKKMPGVKYTSPGTGRVLSINRGPKRVFESIIIELDGDEEITFESFDRNKLENLDREKVISRLIDSGLWTSLRARPFSRVANPEDKPGSIFVTAMDTNPLAPSVEKIINDDKEPFEDGLKILTRLTDGNVYLCQAAGADISEPDIQSVAVKGFSGPHPAGNVGTHIHFVSPVHKKKTVWHIHAQDVIAVGKLFTTGRISTGRVISLGGPSVKNPRLLRVRLGADVNKITDNEITGSNRRIISGSVLSGRKISDVTGFLGRFHHQVTVIPEGDERILFGWMGPGLNKFSLKNVFLSALFPRKKYDFSASLQGDKRSIVPIGSYEKVMPLDILPTFLLRSLMVDDIEEAEKLGCLELDEEDLALCSVVCPSKIEYGPVLRRNLTIIEKEG